MQLGDTNTVAGHKCLVDVDTSRPQRFTVIVIVPALKMRAPDGHVLSLRGFGENLRSALDDALNMMRCSSAMVTN